MEDLGPVVVLVAGEMSTQGPHRRRTVAARDESARRVPESPNVLRAVHGRLTFFLNDGRPIFFLTVAYIACWSSWLICFSTALHLI